MRLAAGLLPCAGSAVEHRNNRPGEVGRRVHQSICAGRLELVAGAITPEHAKAAHSNRMGAGNIVPAIPDHQTVSSQEFVLRQDLGEQFGLVIQPAAGRRTMNAVEEVRKSQMMQNAARESFPLRRGEVDSQPGPPHLIQCATDSRIGLAPQKATLAIVPAIDRHGLIDSVVAIGLQQTPHHVFERRPDGAPDVEHFVRFMAKSAQGCQAACQNAGQRIDQSAVEIQKNGAGRGHDSNITAKGQRETSQAHNEDLRRDGDHGGRRALGGKLPMQFAERQEAAEQSAARRDAPLNSELERFILVVGEGGSARRENNPTMDGGARADGHKI